MKINAENKFKDEGFDTVEAVKPTSNINSSLFAVNNFANTQFAAAAA